MAPAVEDTSAFSIEPTKAKKAGELRRPSFDHADRLEFTLEILVEERPYSQARFSMENTWCNARMEGLPDMSGHRPLSFQRFGRRIYRQGRS